MQAPTQNKAQATESYAVKDLIQLRSSCCIVSVPTHAEQAMESYAGKALVQLCSSCRTVSVAAENPTTECWHEN